jgi:hypothetical protein
VAGTTVAAKSTRLALNSTTPAQPYIKIATVVTSGGSITSITAENNRFASSRVKTVGVSTLATGSRTTSQSITNNTNTVITFDSVTNSDYITGVAGTGVFTAKETGVYSIQGSYVFAYNATGERSGWIHINGVQQVDSISQFTATAAGTSGTRFLMATQFSLTAGDTVEFYIYQNSGGALNLTRSRCAIARLG